MIYKRGDEILSKLCREVDMDDPIDYHIVQECIRALKSEFNPKTMLGLAAPQVGYDICVFLMRDGVYINPKFTPVGQRTCRKEEGCVSIPGLRGELKYSYFYEVLESYNGLKAGEFYKNAHGPDCPGNIMNVPLINELTGEVTYIDKRKCRPSGAAISEVGSRLDFSKLSIS